MMLPGISYGTCFIGCDHQHKKKSTTNRERKLRTLLRIEGNMNVRASSQFLSAFGGFLNYDAYLLLMDILIVYHIYI